MGVLIKACQSGDYVLNTGSNSALLPLATAMLFMVPKSFSFTLDDLGEDNDSMLDFFQTAMHADRPDRIFPLFGSQIPIRNNTNTKGSDVTVTLDDGTPIFVQYGATSKQFATTEGGLCFQRALQSFNNSKFRVIEVDIQGNVVARDNGDGTYGGIIPASLFSPAPDFADFKNPAKSLFQVSYNPVEFVRNAVLFSGGGSLIDLMGLIDLKIADAVGTIAHIDLNLQDTCCDDSVVATIGAMFVGHNTSFTITDDAGADVPITGISVVGGLIRLAATLVSGDTYTVKAALPSNWFASTIEGYEAINEVSVTIP